MNTKEKMMSIIEESHETISLQAIGIIRTPFQEASGTPIQTIYGQNIEGRIELKEPYAEALDDIEGFERLWLIYWMDRTNAFKPKVIPYRDNQEHGLFATRSPSRPNPIGLSIVRFVKRESSILYVLDLDILDGTKLLDIKPYIPNFDSHPESRAGWFDKPGVDRQTADARFHKK
jgi:tRNA-Thr(GGU) m(6)t(6)A37 methyltransferase TsaA